MYQQTPIHVTCDTHKTEKACKSFRYVGEHSELRGGCGLIWFACCTRALLGLTLYLHVCWPASTKITVKNHLDKIQGLRFLGAMRSTPLRVMHVFLDLPQFLGFSSGEMCVDCLASKSRGMLGRFGHWRATVYPGNRGDVKLNLLHTSDALLPPMYKLNRGFTESNYERDTWL